MAKVSQINDVINTTTSVKNNGKSDAQLKKEQFKRAKAISLGPRKKFKCSSIYAAYYPDGFISTYQGIPITLVFDNRIIELPETIIKYVEDKISKKADVEAEKLNNFVVKKQEKIGSIDVE